MRVSELIDFLRQQPGDSEVELAIVSPVEDEEDDITVDRYVIDGVLPWTDTDDESDESIAIWLVGGDDADVDAFLDAIEQTAVDDGGTPTT
ncbi:MAG: hypothetical protein M3501_00410 [Actinomycetota bacterium]|jgi:hypothetical protein|nr:hypothetical protein [Actinomycetota bacterium]MDQ3350415.1 hypothetical protein [Actinomycetota bacterium]